MRLQTRITDIDSSHIESMDYVWFDAEERWKLKRKGALRVTFQNGARYIYEDVPYLVMMNIAADESPGQAFNDLVKAMEYKYYKEGNDA